ncbi:MAG: exodeoxyribonuclease VII small subunit [Candidatus Delongbacteria bacterium]|nr:exodeoxyribonuclease VII small subunit [Candidatus Delongbacteria bacterium]MBN2836408.1 exodeoxyribonuclease VII small subunit [Candidatus Delongbacteria bacterium]
MKYEEAVKRLTEIIEKMEKGDIDLDDTLKMYEEGQMLLKLCKEKISNAEGKLMKIKENGEITNL